MAMEIRSFRGNTSLGEDGNTLIGFIPYNSFSEDLGGFREIIRPHAFDDCLASGADVRCLINHDGLPLARSKSKTLELTTDAKGLTYRCKLPDTSTARDLKECLKRGDIDGSSFGFDVPQGGAVIRREGDKVIRELHKIDLADVSVVTYPAYPSSGADLRTLELRSLESVKTSIDTFLKQEQSDLDLKQKTLLLKAKA